MSLKRSTVILVIALACLLTGIFPTTKVTAQDSGQIITLDDNTPGVGVAINLAPGVPGVIVAGLNHASATLTDSNGAVEFYMADPRVRSLELELMANSGEHILTLSRLPGMQTAYVTLTSQSALMPRTLGHLVPEGALTVDQQRRAIVDSTAQEMMVPIAIPSGQIAAISTTFSPVPLTAQLADGSGVVATAYGGAVDSFSVTLDGGSYLMTLLNSGERAAVATLNVSAAPLDSLASLTPAASQDVAAMPSAQNVSDMSMIAVPQQECTLTVGATPINLRGGPGTGYGVLGHGAVGEQHVVAGQSADGSWLVLADEASSRLWMFSPLGQTEGACDHLPIYDQPVLFASTVSQPPAASDSHEGSATGGNDGHHGGNGDSGDGGGKGHGPGNGDDGKDHGHKDKKKDK